MNRIQQIQHELADMNEVSKIPNENFLLRDEIIQIVESLSVKCLSQKTQLRLDYNKFLPDKLAGDINRFRLAVQSIIEFSTKYCKEGMIDFAINFDGMTQDQRYNIGFDLTIDRNITFNDEPLIRLLSTLSKCSKSLLNESLLSNYEDFFELIVNFGIGIIIFPSLLQALGGQYSVLILDQSPNQAAGGVFGTQFQNLANGTNSKQIFMPIPSETRENSSHIIRSSSRVRISFKIPFDHPDTQKKCVSPYFAFNPYKEDQNGKKLYKSPLLKTREYNMMQRDKMKKIMEESKSPITQARALNPTTVAQVSPFAGLLAGNSVTKIQNRFMDNQNPPSTTGTSRPVFLPFTKQNLGGGSNTSAANLLPPVKILNSSNNDEKRKREENEGKNIPALKEGEQLPQRRYSATSSLAAPQQSNRDLVKKVESTLLNLEKKEPQKQEFFKVPRMGSGMKDMCLGVTPPADSSGGVPLASAANNSDMFFEQSHGNPVDNIKKDYGLNISSSSKKVQMIQNEIGISSIKESSQMKEQDDLDEGTKKTTNFGNLVRIASRVGNLIDRITPGNHAKAGGSMMIGVSKQLMDQAGSNSNILKNNKVSNAVNSQHLQQANQKAESSETLRKNIAEGQINSGTPIKTMGNTQNPSTFKKSLFCHDKKPLVEVRESEDDMVQTIKFGADELQKDREKDSENDHDSMMVMGAQQADSSLVSPFKSPLNHLAPSNQADKVLEKIEEEKEHIQQLIESSHEQFQQDQQNLQESDSQKSDCAYNEDSKNNFPENVGCKSEMHEVKQNLNEISAKFCGSEGLENFDSEKILEEDDFLQNLGARNIQGLNLLTIQNKLPQDLNMVGGEQHASGIAPNINQNVRYNHNLMIKSHSYNVGSASKNLLIFSRQSTPKGGFKTQVHQDQSSCIGGGNNPQVMRSYYMGNEPKTKPIAKTQLDITNGHSQINNEELLNKPNHSDIKRKQQSFEEEELKSVEIVFPYRRGRQTLLYQEKQKSKDYEGQSSLIVWDRALEKRLQKQREEELEMECANVNVTNGGNTNVHGQPFGSTFIAAGNHNYFRNGTLVDSKKRYVLVVEDNRMISMILDESLKAMGIVAIVAENGKIANEKFAEFMHKGFLFELIIMDIIMPEMGGYEATTRIRKMEEQMKLLPEEKHFICGFSAEDSQETRKKCLDVGMNNLVPKPISTDNLKDLVEKNKRITNKIIRGSQPAGDLIAPTYSYVPSGLGTPEMMMMIPPQQQHPVMQQQQQPQQADILPSKVQAHS